MAAGNSLDPAAWLAEQIQAQDPDLSRTMVKTMAEALMPAEADSLCNAAYGERSAQRANHRNGYRKREWDTPRRHHRARHPQAAKGAVFPRMAATAPPCRAGPHQRHRHQLPSGGVHQTHGQARRAARHLRHLQKPGLGHGQDAGRAGGGLPHPPLGHRPLHVCVAGRPHPEGPRRRADRQRARPDRHSGQRQRAAG